MIKTLVTSLGLAVALGASAYADSINVSRASKLGFDQARLAKIAPVMQSYIDQQKLVGTSVLIARKGKVAYYQNFGMQDKEAGVPISQDTLFRIYSMTKPVTAVAALTLWEQGKFHMFDPIEKYLPELKDMKVYAEGEGENIEYTKQQRSITIMDLFLHTSGLSYGFSAHPVDKLYRESQLLSGKFSREQVVAEIAKLPLKHQPGETWTYGIGTDVLGLLVEKLSGMRLGDYMKKHIFEPLQMQDTDFYVVDEKVSRLAKVYTLDPKTGQTVPMQNVPIGDYLSRPEIESGGGGLVSSMSDYLKFAQMLLNRGELKGKRVLAPRTVDYMHGNHLPERLYPFEPGAPGMGFGLAVRVVVEPEKMQYLSAKGNYGWSGLASTFFRISPEDDMIILAMTQHMPNGFYPYQHDFRNLAYQALAD